MARSTAAIMLSRLPSAAGEPEVEPGARPGTPHAVDAPHPEHDAFASVPPSTTPEQHGPSSMQRGDERMPACVPAAALPPPQQSPAFVEATAGAACAWCMQAPPRPAAGSPSLQPQPAAWSLAKRLSWRCVRCLSGARLRSDAASACRQPDASRRSSRHRRSKNHSWEARPPFRPPSAASALACVSSSGLHPEMLSSRRPVMPATAASRARGRPPGRCTRLMFSTRRDVSMDSCARPSARPPPPPPSPPHAAPPGCAAALRISLTSSSWSDPSAESAERPSSLSLVQPASDRAVRLGTSAARPSTPSRPVQPDRLTHRRSRVADSRVPGRRTTPWQQLSTSSRSAVSVLSCARPASVSCRQPRRLSACRLASPATCASTPLVSRTQLCRLSERSERSGDKPATPASVTSMQPPQSRCNRRVACAPTARMRPSSTQLSVHASPIVKRCRRPSTAWTVGSHAAPPSSVYAGAPPPACLMPEQLRQRRPCSGASCPRPDHVSCDRKDMMRLGVSAGVSGRSVWASGRWQLGPAAGGKRMANGCGLGATEASSPMRRCRWQLHELSRRSAWPGVFLDARAMKTPHASPHQQPVAG
eukprot:352121-Chlamydomonas_euryale.AAC.1